MADMIETFRSLKIIPVIVIEDQEQADPLADALLEGGLPCAEITLRTAAGLKAIEKLADRADILVGAGTVLTERQAQAAHEAGARFIISPGMSRNVVRWCREHQLPVFPGISNPTDLMTAVDLGLQTVKFFPAEQYGGVKTLKSLTSVFTGMQFIPTGGITLGTAPAYLALSSVIACGGSWLVKPEWLQDRRFDRIVEETRKAMAAVSGTSI